MVDQVRQGILTQRRASAILGVSPSSVWRKANCGHEDDQVDGRKVPTLLKAQPMLKCSPGGKSLKSPDSSFQKRPRLPVSVHDEAEQEETLDEESGDKVKMVRKKTSLKGREKMVEEKDRPYVKWYDLDEEAREEILHLVRNGQMTQREAGDRLGISASTVWKRAHYKNTKKVGRPRGGSYLLKSGVPARAKSSSKYKKDVGELGIVARQREEAHMQFSYPAFQSTLLKHKKSQTDPVKIIPLTKSEVYASASVHGTIHSPSVDGQWQDVDFDISRFGNKSAILTVPVGNGLLYCYTRTRAGKGKEYFRCSNCHGLQMVRKGKTPLAKVTVCNGQLVTNPFPKHHPDCYPVDEGRASLIGGQCSQLVSATGASKPKERWRRYVKNLQSCRNL